MRVLRAVVFLSVLAIPASAGAVTVRDIIELTKAGLSDDVLIAVIDADRTIFTLDKDQILEMKKAGVSKAVLLKMLGTRREYEQVVDSHSTTSVPVQPAPAPEVVVIGAQPTPPVTVVVPQYLYVPFPIWGVPTHHAPRPAPGPVLAPEYRGFGRFINDGWVERP